MSLFNFRIVLPALLGGALLAWWLIPHYSAEDKAWYAAVFCTISHDDSQQFVEDMQRVIEDGNADYALHKIKYIPDLGNKVAGVWQTLTPEEQQAANLDAETCRRRMQAGL